jgi:hypothetical protein
MSGSTSSAIGSAEIVAALSAVIYAEEPAAMAELRLALEHTAMAAEDTAAHAQRCVDGLERDVMEIATQRLEGESCWACGRWCMDLEDFGSTMACSWCRLTLSVRGWHPPSFVHRARGICECGSAKGMGRLYGVWQCVHCALRVIRSEFPDGVVESLTLRPPPARPRGERQR